MIIAIDFDGTVVTHDYPEIGKDIGAWPVLRELVDNGHQLILYTMRSGMELAAAAAMFGNHNVPLLDVNKNPTQHTWTNSPKVYAHMYIDDAALGTPLVHGSHRRPYVDWDAVRAQLLDRAIIHPARPSEQTR